MLAFSALSADTGNADLLVFALKSAYYLDYLRSATSMYIQFVVFKQQDIITQIGSFVKGGVWISGILAKVSEIIVLLLK